jgi:hypothetical protein
MIAALAVAAALSGLPQQTANPAGQQPVYIREGCGYRPGAATITAIEVGVFFDGDPPFANREGHSIRINGQWTHPDQSPFPDGRSKAWFVQNEPITVGGGSYVKYGLPRVLGREDVTWLAELDGLAVAAEAGLEEPEVVYLLVEPANCGFQPYQRQD